MAPIRAGASFSRAPGGTVATSPMGGSHPRATARRPPLQSERGEAEREGHRTRVFHHQQRRFMQPPCPDANGRPHTDRTCATDPRARVCALCCGSESSLAFVRGVRA